jgi:imidazoleglycerol-phosphate dehydratase
MLPAEARRTVPKEKRQEVVVVRQAVIERKTAETKIRLSLNLDGTGAANITHPVGFYAHMLTLFARHGLFDIELTAQGDTVVDNHHIVEDTGIVLGEALSKALGERRGIRRMGSCLYPMDETLARVALDLSGRAYLVFEAGLPPDDLCEDFWQGFVNHAALALHIDILRGRGAHHRCEAIFKAAASALRQAVELDPRSESVIPSTKGVIV